MLFLMEKFPLHLMPVKMTPVGRIVRMLQLGLLEPKSRKMRTFVRDNFCESGKSVTSLASQKNRNRRKIAAFSNRKVLNRRFCRRNRRKMIQKSPENRRINRRKIASDFFGSRKRKRSVSAFSNRSVFGTLRSPEKVCFRGWQRIPGATFESLFCHF